MMFGMLRYDRADGPGPTQYASSAKRTCNAERSASLKIATVAIPSSLHARMMRSAISPRLATRIFLNTRPVQREERSAVIHDLTFFDEHDGDTSAAARADRISDSERFNECKLAIVLDERPRSNRRPQKTYPPDDVGSQNLI